MSADIQRRRARHKAALLETRAGKRSSCLPGKEANFTSPPPIPKKKKKKIPAVRACREIANSYTGHWCSVQGLMAYVGRCVFPKHPLKSRYEVTLE